MSWTTRPSRWGKPGHANRGDEYEAVLDQIDALTETDWVDYSTDFTIGATTTAPTIGNSTTAAYYHRIPGSNIVALKVRFTVGSTFTAGSGNYDWGLPPLLPESAPFIETGWSAISDTGTAVRVCAVISNSANDLLIFRNDQGNPVGSGGPGTAWATGDWVQFRYVYLTST